MYIYIYKKKTQSTSSVASTSKTGTQKYPQGFCQNFFGHLNQVCLLVCFFHFAVSLNSLQIAPYRFVQIHRIEFMPPLTQFDFSFII